MNEELPNTTKDHLSTTKKRTLQVGVFHQVLPFSKALRAGLLSNKLILVLLGSRGFTVVNFQISLSHL
jgi:hypothetical protein